MALLPAAGRSLRLSPLPCSKELLPVGFATFPGIQGYRPKVASHYLLECLQEADVTKGYMVIRQGKWDIPSYWGDGRRLGMELAYIVIEGSAGPPDTIDRAYGFVKDNVVAFGFPDILFRPRNVFSKLIARLESHGGDVVLALFPPHDRKSMDMIDVDNSHRVRAIHLKPKASRLTYAWLCAVWTPAFTEFLHEFVDKARRGRSRGLIGNRRIDPQGDIPVGAVLRAAVQSKLRVDSVTFPTGSYVDVGTPEHLVKAVMHYSRV